MPTTAVYREGQRWISVSEPELGLGEVRRVGPRTVTLWFPATQQTREYVSGDGAPIRRAAFRPGDTITTKARGTVVVRDVMERDGLLHYASDREAVPETELHDALSFNSPLDRLYAGHFDRSSLFDLRLSAVQCQHRRRCSRVRGFVGGRIDLLPHQLAVAAEVAERMLPRVLLADEVGLGKTIEACLIVHRLLLTGRASRVLIVVPETLVHQWFLELLRRFNLWFHIFNEGRCAAIQDADPAANPFLDDQLILCELSLFTSGEGRLEQARAAGWDLVVVDEAHHLRWTPEAPSVEYQVVEQLATASTGVLLLTATPEQLGVAGHFARLRLLDPDRFPDLDAFVRESHAYANVARLAGVLDGDRPLTPDECTELARTLGDTPDAVTAAVRPDAPMRREVIERLLDQHGTGRVMFRNTRASIGRFPARVAHLDAVRSAATGEPSAIAAEWRADTAGAPPAPRRLSLGSDPRVDWLVNLLRDLGSDKVLLICHTAETAAALESELRRRTTLAAAVFHEGLTLIQRDRGAASFGAPDGARLLICSEIGSEGRNFQFAHHLVLFDLPVDPGLVEQRIGRLDRIGQRTDIHIHVPVVEDSYLAVLARWYHEGLGSFEHHVPGARELLDQFEPALRALAARAYRDRRVLAPDLDAFIREVRGARTEIAARLEEGRDRLLEWHSHRPARSAPIVAEIERFDEDRSFDAFMLAVFDQFFIDVEELAPRTYRLGSAGVLVDDFPGLSGDTITVTTDRARALAREDLQFLTWDHPLATGALDMLLASERGNCAFARWADADASGLYLEALFVLECLAPAPLHVDRFLAPTPVRVVVDHHGRDAADALREATITDAQPSSGAALLSRPDLRDRLLPRLADRATLLAEARTPPLVNEARHRMRDTLDREIARLRDLQKVNRLVTDAEIAALAEQRDALDQRLDGARVRLDAIRVIHRGPER